MEENKNKFNAFKSARLQDWEVAARNELDGANPWEKLAHPGGGWSIRPFYDRNDVTQPFSLPLSENIFIGPRTWYNCPGIFVKDPKTSNQKALEYLRGGADGIFFELDTDVNLEDLLKGIEWQYCSLNFLVKNNRETFAQALGEYIRQKRLPADKIHGALFGDQVPRPMVGGNFRFAGFQSKASVSPVEELVSGFTTMITTLQKEFPKATSQVAFSVTVGTDFFLTMAKLRAMRVLWNRCLATLESTTLAPLFIHAISTPWIDKKYQPQENMLKSTTAAISAVLGGCDSLTLVPAEEDNSTMIRVARNVSNILREESHFSKVADPVAGSYFIENLTHQLTESAWTSIQPYFNK